MKGHYFKDFEIDENGLNSKLSCKILPDELMEYHCFYKSIYNENEWWFVQKVYHNIILRIKIFKDGRRMRIDIIDKYKMEIFDYQYILSFDKYHKKAVIVKREVDYWIEYLNKVGIIEGYEEGMYI